MGAGGAIPAGSGRALRLDPLALPVSFPVTDAGADEGRRVVELHRERVILRRAVRGMRITVSLPVSTYLGVAIRVIAPDALADGAVAVMLEHRDPALSVPLFVAADGADMIAEWQLWARVFQLPVLVADDEGALREPFARIGSVRVASAAPRRRRRCAIKKRRPSILMRRKSGRRPAELRVYRGEREIIARN